MQQLQLLVHKTKRHQFFYAGIWHNKKTNTFNGPLSGTTHVSQYQKGKINLDFTESRDSEWQWH